MKFEEYLQEEHQKDYIGSKDLALESYENWLQDLDINDWISLGNIYGCNKALEAYDMAVKTITSLK